MVRVIPVVVLAACVPKASLAPPIIVQFPSNVWTARPVPFAYSELGEVTVQSWTLDQGLVELLSVSRAELGCTDVLDVVWSLEFHPAAYGQCPDNPGCIGDGVLVSIWTVTGLAVERLEHVVSPIPL